MQDVAEEGKPRSRDPAVQALVDEAYREGQRMALKHLASTFHKLLTPAEMQLLLARLDINRFLTEFLKVLHDESTPTG